MTIRCNPAATSPFLIGMAAFVTLALPAAATAAAQSRQEGDVVVTGRKMDRWQAALIMGDSDTTRCRIMRLGGDPAHDAEGCAAMQRCFDDNRPRILAARDRTLTPMARRRLLSAVDRDVGTCFATVSRRFATQPAEPPAVP